MVDGAVRAAGEILGAMELGMVLIAPEDVLTEAVEELAASVDIRTTGALAGMEAKCGCRGPKSNSSTRLAICELITLVVPEVAEEVQDLEGAEGTAELPAVVHFHAVHVAKGDLALMGQPDQSET